MLTQVKRDGCILNVDEAQRLCMCKHMSTIRVSTVSIRYIYMQHFLDNHQINQHCTLWMIPWFHGVQSLLHSFSRYLKGLSYLHIQGVEIAIQRSILNGCKSNGYSG